MLSNRSHFAGQTSQLTETVVSAATVQRHIVYAKLLGYMNWECGHNQFLYRDSSASKACLILLPLHDGDETCNSWKPLLNTS